jgi:hypothetical protein
MLTPIRPSLSQALLRQGNAAQAQSLAQPNAAGGGNAALDAQRAFFRQVTGQAGGQTTAPTTQAVPTPVSRPVPGLATQSLRAQIDAASPPKSPQTAQTTPQAAANVFKAADVQQARINALQNNEGAAPLRPGSLLNIVV